MEPTFVPIDARRFAIAFMFLAHIQFAAFIIGIIDLAVVIEFFWILHPGQPKLDRLAHGLGKTAAIMYSVGATFAFGAFFFLSIFWPVFFDIIMRATFWPFVLEAFTFILSLLYLFPWFFTWSGLERFKWVHLALGSALVIAFNLQQTMIDVVASFMLTPTPSELFPRVFFNPTSVPLDLHRVIGDVSFAAFVVAGFSAFRTLRAREDGDRAYWDWVGSLAMVAALGFMYLQPLIGIEYVEEIRVNSSAGFDKMMRGQLSWLFIVQVFFLSVLFLLSIIYILIQTRKSSRPGVPVLWVLLVIALLGSLLVVQPYVIGARQGYQWVNWINPIGSMQPWRYIGFAGQTLAAIFAVWIFIGAIRRRMRWGFLGQGGQAAQYLLITLAIFASFMMALMGYIRENSRVPFIIFNNVTINERERFPQQLPMPSQPTGPPSEPTSSYQGTDAPVPEPEPLDRRGPAP